MVPPPTRIQPAAGALARARVPLLTTAVALVVIAGAFVVAHPRDRTPEKDSAGSITGAQAPIQAAQASPAQVAITSESTEAQSTSASDPEGTNAYDQAAAIDALLEESKPSRGTLRRAIGQILRCTRVGEGVSAIAMVTSQRGKQAKQAKKLQVDVLHDGYELKDALVRSLTASYQADKAYLKWAKRYRASGCRGRTVGDSAYDAGNVASTHATAAKFDFVSLWNPVAREQGLPARSEAEI